MDPVWFRVMYFQVSLGSGMTFWTCEDLYTLHTEYKVKKKKCSGIDQMLKGDSVIKS